MDITKVKCLLNTKPQPSCASCALFFLRIVAGTAFIYHGWGKIQDPFAWMGSESQVPGFFQFLAALSEFGGGIAWILGLLSNLFSLGIGFTMLVAVYTHLVILKHPFVSGTGGGAYELAAVYLSIAVLLFTLGPGKFSVDNYLFGEKK